MKRFLSLILAASLLACAFAGCSDAPENADSPASSESGAEAPSSSEEAAEVTPEEPAVTDDLPETDLDGLVFNTLIREEARDEFDPEAQADVVDEAVFNRNMRIGDRFNCTLTYTIEPGNWANNETFKAKIRSTVMAGDSTFDMVTGQSNIVQPLNVEHVFVNLLDEAYLDLTKPYWVDAYTEGINLGGEVCTVCGDFAISSFSNANVIFFNQDLVTQYGLESPFSDALAGTWTMDKLVSLSDTVTTDVNGDGNYTMDDIRGFCAYNNSIQPLFSSMGLTYTEIGPEGKRVVKELDDRTVNAYDRTVEFYNTKGFVDSSKESEFGSSTQEPDMARYFSEGKYLFMGMVLEGIEHLRDMESDFGILPYPKYDEEQTDYFTTILRRYTVAAVPATASAPSTSALILEAMSCDGCVNIVPKYYEIALKNKYLRDADSVQVLDLIKDSLYLEFVDMYYNDLAFSDFFSGYVAGGQTGTLASQYKSNIKVWGKKIEQLYKAYETPAE